MDFTKIPDHITGLSDNLKKYIGLRFEVLKCQVAEALARMASILLIIFVVSLLLFIAVFFLSTAFVDWFAENVGKAYVGALIVAGFYLVVACVLILVRRRIFINPLVSAYSKILIEESDEEE